MAEHNARLVFYVAFVVHYILAQRSQNRVSLNKSNNMNVQSL